MSQFFAGFGRTTLLLVAGAVAGGAVVAHTSGGRTVDDEQPEVRSGAAGLVNPLLECREGNRLRRTIAPFTNRISALLARHRSAGGVTRASVYFRDLNNGPWCGVGEDDEYRIASLLKLPLLLGYLKRAEAEPDVLEREVWYGRDADPQEVQNVPPERRLERGKSYRVGELLERAIRYSDNEAAALLADADQGVSLERVRELAGFPPFRDGTLYLAPRHFASLLRILYNASYLGEPMSERALDLLTTTAFRDGLVAGVPAGVVVAHKFGERRDGALAQLHDCGIVYHPGRPYVLCVMTEGPRFADLAATIAAVSRLAWEEVGRQQPSTTTADTR